MLHGFRSKSGGETPNVQLKSLVTVLCNMSGNMKDKFNNEQANLHSFGFFSSGARRSANIPVQTRVEGL